MNATFSQTLHARIAALLAPASVIAVVGTIAMAYRIHPILAAVTLFAGWLAYGASRDWLSRSDAPTIRAGERKRD